MHVLVTVDLNNGVDSGRRGDFDAIMEDLGFTKSANVTTTYTKEEVIRDRDAYVMHLDQQIGNTANKLKITDYDRAIMIGSHPPYGF